MPPWARVSAAAPPAGPPPMTATLRLRPVTLGLDLEALMRSLRGVEMEVGRVLERVMGWFSGVDWRSPMKVFRAMEAIDVFEVKNES